MLREKASEVVVTDETKGEIKSLVDDMFETMSCAEGVGLAAPQIGKSIRLLVVDGSDLAEDMPELEGFRFAMINPVLVEESEETAVYSEGCLSVPGINAEVKRPARIRVRFLDENFAEQDKVFEGFGCRIVQHEMDHLDGYMFVDRVAPIRRKMMQSKLSGIAKGKARTTYRIK